MLFIDRLNKIIKKAFLKKVEEGRWVQLLSRILEKVLSLCISTVSFNEEKFRMVMECMKILGLISALILKTNGDFTLSISLSVTNQDFSLPEQVFCFDGKPVRSSNSLYLGNGDKQHVLRMEFSLYELTSNLSSFDLRTFDSEGVIFYGDVGKDSWFVLGIRDKRLEVQMSNANGQMVLSKWGPDLSDGKWRKVTVDSSINTIEVRVDGEVVVKLTHHVNTELPSQGYTTLSIILGDLPEGSEHQLLRPLQPALDGCMRNWAWVKKDTQALEVAMETDENRRCFEQEEHGSFFPRHGYAIFKPSMFYSLNNEAWRLSIKVKLRVLEDGGILLTLNGAENVTALEITLDWQKQVLLVNLLGKLTGSVIFPVDMCPGHWQSAEILIQSNKMVLRIAEAESSWDINPQDLKALENVWLDPAAQISIGGVQDHSAEAGPRFSGCLNIILQDVNIDLETAQYKHPHVRSHSCPQWI
ncbi:sex hormone-binding globulin-like [Rhinophrynus dorsalis]